jgi:hypothetical protein
LRRLLRAGAIVQDYVFQEGPSNLEEGDVPIQNVRLSELFSGPNRSVVIYHFMYGKGQITTLALEDGATFGCSVAGTTRSSTTFAAKTAKAIRIRPFRSSHAIATALFITSTLHTPGWARMSRSVESIC